MPWDVQTIVYKADAACGFSIGLYLKGCLLIASTCIAVSILRRQSASTKHTLWLATFVGIGLLPAASIVLPHWEVESRWLYGEAPRAALQPSVVKVVHAGSYSNDFISKSNSASVQPNDSIYSRGTISMPQHETAPDASSSTHLSVQSEIGTASVVRATTFTIWTAVAAFLFVRLLLDWVRLNRATSGCERVGSGRLFDRLQVLRGRLNIRSSVTLLVGTESDTPKTWGFWSYYLLLPPEAHGWNNQQLDSTLLHELAHIRRRDPVVQVYVQAIWALNWCNPFAWYAASQIRSERERACDDLTINYGADKCDYAEHLLRIASGRTLRGSLAVGMAASSGIERRIQSILDDRIDRKEISFAGGAGLFMAALLLVTPVAMLQTSSIASEQDNQRRGHTASQDNDTQRQLFRGISLSDSPPMKVGDQRLDDFWVEHPASSKNFTVREDVWLIPANSHEIASTAVVFFRPDLQRYVIQKDRIGASVQTFYGPYEGNPIHKLNLSDDLVRDATQDGDPGSRDTARKLIVLMKEHSDGNIVRQGFELQNRIERKLTGRRSPVRPSNAGSNAAQNDSNIRQPLRFGHEERGLVAAILLDPAKTEYRIGDTIQTKFVIQNNSDQTIRFSTANWRQEDQLNVRDASGNPVHPVGHRTYSGEPTMVRHVLAPGQQVAVEGGEIGIGDGKNHLHNSKFTPPVVWTISASPGAVYTLNFACPIPDVNRNSDRPDDTSWTGWVTTGDVGIRIANGKATTKRNDGGPEKPWVLEQRRTNELIASGKTPLQILASEHGYFLPAGKKLRNVRQRIACGLAPWPLARAMYFHEADAEQAEAIPDGPDAIFFRQTNQLSRWGWHFGKSRINLKQALDLIAGIKPQHVDGDKHLLEQPVAGDWIVDANATEQEIVNALEEILRAEYGRPIRIRFRYENRNVWVATGSYRFTPIGTEASKNGLDALHILEHFFSPTGSGATGSFDEFLEWLGQWTQEPVVNEITGKLPAKIDWTLHATPEFVTVEDQLDRSKRMLANITKQTGLTFRRDKRTVRRLFIEKTNE